METRTEKHQASHTAEMKRRRRERIIIVAVVIGIVLLTFIETSIFSKEALVPDFRDVVIFGLINVNIILVLLLIFLIVRNIVKLVYERRRGILGSKLRTKLVAAFVTLSLVPTFILFLVATNFLSYSIDNWFNIRVGGALNLSLELAQKYYQQTSENVKYYAEQLSADITKNRLFEKDRLEYLRSLVEQRQRIYKLGLIEIYFNDEADKLVFKDPGNPDIPDLGLSPKLREDIRAGKQFTTMQSVGLGDFIRGIAPVYVASGSSVIIGAVVVNCYVPKGLVDKMTTISRISEEYKQFKLLKNPIKTSYIVILFVVTLLIIFSATWFGFFLAKGITEPVQDLAEATHAIAQGNLDYKINVVADDEIGVLVNSFNRMTSDLKVSKENLEQANLDLEQRRKYMETVLRNVSAGVVAIDREGVITTVNRAAEKLLDIKTEKVLHHRYEEVLQPGHLDLVREILTEITGVETGYVEKQIPITLKDRALTLLVTTTVLLDDENNYMGMVVVFEDITQLQRAERIAAWREVARRIAHEIKNPLTPIQLSAQRLQRKFADRLSEDGPVFMECTGTIISQVDVLKNLVNEFSRYARMPVASLTPNDLNEVVRDAVVLYQDAHKEIAFDYRPDPELPRLRLDAEQIKRVMVNLLDNAVAAVSPGTGRIEVVTAHDREHRRARVEVRDNGIGVTRADKAKMFEPYYSTKKSGSGLGLAIVSSIISEHRGSVTVEDNVPTGTIVAFELPVEQAEEPVLAAAKAEN
ncbi:MAG TPA: ATP-binding protein [Syntrophales bacterium]|nr:ATP-binding protein [Syntrophales bacterium]